MSAVSEFQLSEGVNSSDVVRFGVLPCAFLDDITVSLLLCKVCNKCMQCLLNIFLAMTEC